MDGNASHGQVRVLNVCWKPSLEYFRPPSITVRWYETAIGLVLPRRTRSNRSFIDSTRIGIRDGVLRVPNTPILHRILD